MNPSLTKVILSRDVLHSCLSHALSTEHQEVMGLLLGQVFNQTEAHIVRSIVLSRKDKQKDRVEVGYEHLAAASTIADKLTEAEGSQQNVIGWYHSHPHITVMPSHVDVKTQGCYQQLDSNFVGLIFSVFDDKSGNMDVCAFQSLGEGDSLATCTWRRIEIPIVVTHLHDPSRSLSTLSGDQLLTTSATKINKLDKNDKFDDNLRNNLLQHKKESLVSLQQVLLNEAQSAFRETLASRFSAGTEISAATSGGEGGAGFSCTCDCSELEICRLASVYHLNLLRLVDVQLLPTFQALRSHRLSLEKEKELLLELVDNTKDINSERDEMRSTLEEAKGMFTRPLAVLESMQPQWSRAMRALRLAFSGSRGVHAACHSLPFFADLQGGAAGRDNYFTLSSTFDVRVIRTHPSVKNINTFYSFDTTASDCGTSPPHICPWSIEFRRCCGSGRGSGSGSGRGVGVEDINHLHHHDGSGVFVIPLLAINSSSVLEQREVADGVEVVVREDTEIESESERGSMRASRSESSHSSSSSSSRWRLHTIRIQFRGGYSVSSLGTSRNEESSGEVGDESDASYWRRDLSRALRLDVFHVTDKDSHSLHHGSHFSLPDTSAVVDISGTQTP